MPTLREIDGWHGLSLLVDRGSGRCIAAGSWDSRETMRSNDERVWPVWSQAAEMFGGHLPVMDQWEIAVMHRDHRSGLGAGVRATWLKVRPEQFERAIDYYRIAVLPAIEEFEGFCSASMMLDHASARAVTSVTYDSLDAMRRTEDQARSLRTAQLRDHGMDQFDVGEFELALAHLGVPELV